MIPLRVRILALVGYVLILAAAIVLSGCPSAPEVRYEPIEVPVPVKIPCAVAPPEEPKWAVDELAADANDFRVAQAYRAERRQREQYVKEMNAAIAGCARHNPATKGSP